MNEDLKRNKNIWDRLHGRRVLVVGQESDAKSRLLRELKDVSGTEGVRFQISEHADEMCSEDYVILSGISDRKEIAEISGSEAKPWKRVDDREYKNVDGWHEFSLLTDILQKIERVKPQAVLLMSDGSVYGKLYGKEHPVTEAELGYVSHTDSKDQQAYRLRVTEHLCSRMANEDGIAVKIARVSKEPKGEAVLRVLLDGIPGEAYNISDAYETENRISGTSALEPNLVVMDTGKAGGLG